MLHHAHRHAHRLTHILHHALSCGPVTGVHDLVVHAITLHAVLAVVGFVSRLTRN